MIPYFCIFCLSSSLRSLPCAISASTSTAGLSSNSSIKFSSPLVTSYTFPSGRHPCATTACIPKEPLNPTPNTDPFGYVLPFKATVGPSLSPNNGHDIPPATTALPSSLLLPLESNPLITSCILPNGSAKIIYDGVSCARPIAFQANDSGGGGCSSGPNINTSTAASAGTIPERSDIEGAPGLSLSNPSPTTPPPTIESNV